MAKESISDQTFINENGYLEYKYSQGKGSNLVHRRVAFAEIYDPEKYPYNFEEYEIHHKNSEKLDNDSENLELQLPNDHYSKHFDKNHMRIDKKNKKIGDYTQEEKKISPVRIRSLEIEQEPQIFRSRRKSFWQRIKEFFGIGTKR